MNKYPSVKPAVWGAVAGAVAISVIGFSQFGWTLGSRAASAMRICGEADEVALAHDIVEVHGAGAAAVARENARTAALAGQPMLAKSWIRILGAIQRQQADKAATLPNDA